MDYFESTGIEIMRIVSQTASRLIVAAAIIALAAIIPASAGLAPAGYIAPDTMRAMGDKGLDALFRSLGLEEWRDRLPGALSLGLARRVSLARALAGDPELLLLDEPFVSLDTASAQALRTVLLASFERSGQAVLMVTHDLREAVAMADRLLLLTPTPARLRAEIALEKPRPSRDEAFIEAERRRILTLVPGLAA